MNKTSLWIAIFVLILGIIALWSNTVIAIFLIIFSLLSFLVVLTDYIDQLKKEKL